MGRFAAGGAVGVAVGKPDGSAEVVAVGAGVGVGLPPVAIASVVVAIKAPVVVLAEIRPVPSVVALGMGNRTLNHPLADATNVASRQPLMVKLPACPTPKPLPATVICEPGEAEPGTTRVGVVGGVTFVAPAVGAAVVLASSVPELVLAEIRPVLPSAADAGIASVTLNAPVADAPKVVRTAPL